MKYFALIMLVFCCMINWICVYAATEIRRPTSYTDDGGLTTNPSYAYDANDATSADTEYDTDLVPSITYHTWQANTTTYDTLYLWMEWSVDAATDDQYQIQYSTDGGNTWIIWKDWSSAGVAKENTSVLISPPVSTDLIQVRVNSERVKGPENMLVHIFELWTEGTYKTWDSYIGGPCSVQSDTFSVGDTVYVCGDGYTPFGLYNISIYDGSDSRVYFGEDVQADSSGILSDSYTIQNTDSAGNWHSQVFSGPAPTTYTADDPNEVAEDLSAGTYAFSVGASEFIYLVIPFISAFGTYFLIKRKFANYSHGKN